MKGRSLLILFLLTLGFGAYIYFGIQKPSELRETHKDTEGRVALGDLNQVQSLKIQTLGQTVTLEKTTGSHPHWRMTSPAKDIAASSKIDTLISALGKLKKSKVIVEQAQIKTAGDKLAQFNLAPAKLKLEYKTSDMAAPTTMLFGGTNPAGTGVYAQAGPDSEVLLTGLELDYLNTQTPDDYREMRIATVDSNEFAEVQIEAKGKKMKFARDADQKWIMMAPYANLPIDSEFTRSELQKVSFVRANRFLDKLPSALEKPDIRVIVGFKENVSDERSDENDKRPHGVEIIFGKSEKVRAKTGPKTSQAGTDDADRYEYFAKSDKTSPAIVARFHYDSFNRSPEEFIRKSMDVFELSNVKSLTLQSKGSSIEIHKTNDQYEAVQKNEKKSANKQAVEAALMQLRSLRASKFVSVVEKLPTASFSARVETLDGKVHQFALGFEKDFSDLWYQNAQRRCISFSAKILFALKSLSGPPLLPHLHPLLRLLRQTPIQSLIR